MKTFWLTLLALSILIPACLAVYTAYVERRIAREFRPDGRFIEIDGKRIHYVDVGHGPALVMVHGLGGQLRHFSHSLVACLRHDFRMILIDRPGSGHSPPARGLSGIEAQGKLIAQVITALRLEHPVVVGHSLGGAVALSAALDHPDCIGGLALIAPLTHVPESVPGPFRAMAIHSKPLRWLLSRTLLIPVAMRYSAATLEVVFGPEAVPADFPTAGGGILSLRPCAYLAASLELQRVDQDLPGISSRYGALTMPVGILFGLQDRILDYRLHGASMRERVGHLRLETIAGGHMLPLTNAAASAAFIRMVATQAAAEQARTAQTSAPGPV